MREIIFDTETTGLDPLNGDRIVEIGAVEVVNGIPSGMVFHEYINPERDMPADAFRVHGLSSDFLKDKPRFAEVAPRFLGFAADAKLVAHNASFDVAFLNAELTRAGHSALRQELVVDTLTIARRKHPGQSNTLDALCQRYAIDNTRRTKHGALLDAELLAEVYLELTGGRQAALALASSGAPETGGVAAPIVAKPRPVPLPPRLSAEERRLHATFLATFGAEPVWSRYPDLDADAAVVLVAAE